MNKDCVFWINMPHQVGIAVVVIIAVIIGIYTHTGVYLRDDMQNLCEYMVDGRWADYDKTDCPEDSSCSYYCHCAKYENFEWTYLETGARPLSITHDNQIKTTWSWEEWRDRSLKSGDTIPSTVNASSATAKYAGKRLLEDSCVAEGLTEGRTLSFMAAVMCEMMRAYTVKSKLPVYDVFTRNKVMHAACFFSFIMTLAVTLVPGVQTVFKTAMIEWIYYFIAIGLALCCAANDEVWKAVYRRELRQRKRNADIDSLKASEVGNQIAKSNEKKNTDVQDVQQELAKVSSEVQSARVVREEGTARREAMEQQHGCPKMAEI